MSTFTTTRRIAFAAICLVAAAALGTFALMQSPAALKGSGKALVGGPFTMVNHKGETVTEKDFLGRPMLLFFGFTFCPDVCPTELQVMTEALKQVPDLHVRPVLVSVDPERDTPQQLAGYVANFSDEMVGLTGSAEQIAQMARAYKVAYSKVENKERPEDYTMDHSSIIYLMGSDGEFAKHFTYTTDAAALAEGIRAALQ